MRFATFNVRSLVNKTVGVMEHLQDTECDVCFVQETFLRDGDNAKLAEIREYGWNILSNPRKYRSGGGIAMLYKNSIDLKCNTKVAKYKSFQVMESLLKTDKDLIRLVNIYRPPYTKKARFTECDFLEEFESYLKDLSQKQGDPILAGDFNFHMERPTDAYPKKFQQLLDDFLLHQHVPLQPTHDQGGTLDLILTHVSFKDKLQPPVIIPSSTRSDHFLVHFDVELKPKVCEDLRFSSYRRFKDIDVDEFKTDLMNSELQNVQEDMVADEAFSLYNKVLTQLMDKHCPVIKKKIREKQTPWIDLELRTLRRRRRAAERAWRKGKGQKSDYIKLRDQFSALEFAKRCAHHKSSLKASSGDTKMLYKKLNKLLGNESQDLPSHNDSKKLSEDFKNFFSQKIATIRSDIEKEAANVDSDHLHDGDLDSETLPADHPSFRNFSEITEEQLKDLISKMPNKFCCLDPIPPFLLKNCLKELTPILMHIVNSSLTSGTFPSEMKSAVIKPTLKKQNVDKDVLSNYRPVSNLSAVSKLLERTVLNQLNQHLTDNELYSKVQSGYRPKHSCETLMVRMFDDINNMVQADNIVIVVLLDLSAAFDTIDHSVLLGKLLTEYGIDGSALQWCKSYLEKRTFAVKINDKISAFLELIFGVPQGSLLGPILFILYTKTLQKIAAKYGLDIQLYADDSQLYISFQPSRLSQLDDVKDRTNRCLAEIKTWMVANFMKLNESKTELLVLGKPHILKTHSLDISLQFGSDSIKPTECKKDTWESLGVKLDATLSLERQINSVKQKCGWTMMNLRTIGRYLDESTKLMMVKQLVISKLDYCNALYINLKKTLLNKLISILNGAVRFIYNISDRSTDLVPYYKKAHILPVVQRIFFKVCLFAHKAVHGLSPGYIKELIEVEVSTETGTCTRSKIPGDCFKLKIQKMSKNKFDERRFSNYAPSAWNSLPLGLRQLEKTDRFKRMLKNYLFDGF